MLSGSHSDYRFTKILISTAILAVASPFASSYAIDQSQTSAVLSGTPSAETTGGTPDKADHIGEASSGNLGNKTSPVNQINGAIEWDSDNKYWQKTYPTRRYYDSKTEYGVFEPAYHYGASLSHQYKGKPFAELNEAELRTGWDNVKGKSSLTWDQAKDAVEDAYNRRSQDTGHTVAPAR